MHSAKLSQVDNKQRPLKLLIVVVNYFSANLISRLVSQLNEQLSNADGTHVQIDSLPIHVSIVCADNSTTKEQQDELRAVQKNSKIELILQLNERNLGFGRAINQSVNKQEFDFLCCVNPDVTLSPNTISAFLSHAINNIHQGIWGCLTIGDQGQPDFRHAWQEPSLKSMFVWMTGTSNLFTNHYWQASYKYMEEVDSKTYPVDAISGCCFLISNQAWSETQGFDVDFFLYSEEIDLCRRARLSGFQPTVVSDAKIKHSAHAKNESVQQIKAVYLAKMLYASKHHGRIYNFFYKLLMLMGSILRVCKYSAAADFKIAKTWLWLAGQSMVSSRSWMPEEN